MHLNFLESEASSRTKLSVVPNSRAPYSRAKRTSRSRSKSTGFLYPGHPPTVFPGRLVEPCLDKPLPILVEMPIRDHIITFRSHFWLSEKRRGKFHQHLLHKISYSSTTKTRYLQERFHLKIVYRLSSQLHK